MRSPACPPPADLAAFARGDLPPAAIDAVAAHLEDCPECGRMAERLDDIPDALAAALRGLATPTPSADGRTGTWPDGPAAAADTAVPAAERTLPAAEPSPKWLGRYEVLEELGRGGMGVVYKGYDPDLKRHVALKVILAGRHATPAESVRFHREAEAAARVRHPNLVQIYEIGQHDGLPFLAFEYAPGGGLDRFLRGEPQPTRTAAALVATLAAAVQACHAQGVVHRDLKPANILLTGSGLAGPKVTDFGLAKCLDGGPAVTASGAVAGTPSYMAPEQAAGRTEQVGPAADVYALGAILYELLVGRPPFRGGSAADTLVQVVQDDPVAPSRLRRGVPRDLETVCQKCLSKDPRRRYATAGELADDLSRFLDNVPVQARRAGAIERMARKARRNPVAAGLLVLAVVSLIGGTVASTIFAIQATDAATQAGQNAQDARTNEAHAVNEKKKADEARAEADVAREQSRWGLYRAQMHQAGQSRNYNRALTRIDALLAPWRPEPGVPDLRGWEWYYLNALGHQDLLSIPNGTRVLDIAWSPDGDRLAAAGADGAVRVWWADGSPAGTFGGVGRPVRCLAWSPDGMTLATGGADGAVCLWDPAGTFRRALPGPHKGPVRAVSWRPDGARLGSAGEADDRIVIRDPGGHEADHALSVQTGIRSHFNGVAWSPDWTRVAIWGRRGTCVADLSGDRPEVNIRGAPGDAAWSPDGKRLTIGRSDLTIGVADATTGEIVATLYGHRHWVVATQWSPDGLTLASAGIDDSVRLWDTRTGLLLHTYLGLGHDAQHAVAWSPRGDRLASGGMDGRIRVWPARPPVARVTETGNLTSVSWSPDGGQVAATVDGQSVRVIDRWTRQPVGPRTGYRVGAHAAAWAPAGDRIACATQNGAVVFVPAANGMRDARTLRPGIPAAGVGWSPDGRRLATTSTNDPTVRLWDPVTETQVGQFSADAKSYRVVSWSRDGRFVAAATGDGVRVWEVAGGRVVALRSRHGGRIDFLAWGPGPRLAAGSTSGRVTLWDAATGQVQRELFAGSQDWIRGLAWSPDGRRLAASPLGSGVHVWDPDSGEQVFVCETDGAVSDLAWSPDGRCLAGVAAPARHLALWDTARTDEFYLAPERLPATQIAARADELIRWERADDAAALAAAARRQAPATLAVALAAADIDRRAGELFRKAGRPADAAAAEGRATEAFSRLLAADPPDPAAIRGLADTLLQAASRWQVLTPTGLHSAGGSTLTIGSDGSLRAGGAGPADDAYRLTARVDLPYISAIRLEALPDPQLPYGGPGRSPANGDFMLTEFGLTVGPAGRGAPAPARLTGVCSDQRPTDAEHVVLGERGAGWHPDPREPHYMIARADRPATAGVGATVAVTLGFRHPGSKGYGLGRFRLAVSADPRAYLAVVLRAASRDDVPDLSRLAAGHLLTGDPAAAVRCLQAVPAGAAAGDVCGWMVLALACHETGSAADASRWYDRSMGWLRRHPAPAPVRELAAEMVARVGRMDPAVARELVAGWAISATAWTPAPWLTRGHAAAAGGDWELAARSLVRAVGNRPANAYDVFTAGPLALYAGDVGGYALICDELLDRAYRSHDPTDAERAAKVCLLRPGCDRLNRAARLAVSSPANPGHVPYMQLVRGLAEYRLGDFDASERWLKQAASSADVSRVVIPARLVLAMVHHRRGEAAAARSELERAVGMMNDAFPTPGPGPGPGEKWPEYVYCHVLKAEVEALLGVPRPLP
jgi:WD40 repeat protein